MRNQTVTRKTTIISLLLFLRRINRARLPLETDRLMVDPGRCVATTHREEIIRINPMLIKDEPVEDRSSHRMKGKRKWMETKEVNGSRIGPPGRKETGIMDTTDTRTRDMIRGVETMRIAIITIDMETINTVGLAEVLTEIMEIDTRGTVPRCITTISRDRGEATITTTTTRTCRQETTT